MEEVGVVRASVPEEPVNWATLHDPPWVPAMVLASTKANPRRKSPATVPGTLTAVPSPLENVANPDDPLPLAAMTVDAPEPMTAKESPMRGRPGLTL